MLAAVALSMGVATTAMAQDESRNGWFVGAQGGAQVTFTNHDATELITPQAAVQVGKWINPMVGARLHVQGWEYKSAIVAPKAIASDKYSFNGITGDVDLLLGLTDIINPNRQSHAVNLYGVLGFGVNYTWNYDKFYNATATIPNHEYSLCGTKHSTFNGRLGLGVDLALNNNWSVNLEADANYKNDLFNLKTNEQVDWQACLLAGVTYHFGKCKKAAAPVEAPVTSQRDYEAEAAAAAEAARLQAAKAKAEAEAARAKAEAERKAAETALRNAVLDEHIHFQIRESDPNNEEVLSKAAQWAKDHADKQITVTGYADKGTGNPRVNKMYARLRATKVADALKAKGVPADQLIVESMGDTVQPHAVNDENRCTIIVGK